MADNTNDRDTNLPNDEEGFEIEEGEMEEYQNPDEGDISGIRGGRLRQEEDEFPETDEDMI